MRNTFLILIAVLLILSCSQKHTHADKFIFTYNQPGGISSLDPAFARDLSNTWAANQLFNGLVQMDVDMNISPAIAASYSIDSTGTHYIFNLRDDVFFHKNACFGSDSTRAVIADDFVFSLNRLTDNSLASPGGWTMENVDSIWASDHQTLHIVLNKPFAPFLGTLTMKYFSVVPREAIEKYGSSFGINPVGTGPFRHIAWHRNEKLVLRKNENYFEQDENDNPLPYADGVAVRFITDPQAAFLEFLKGNIDLISGLDASYKDEILTPTGELEPKYADRFALAKQPYLNTEYLIFTVDTAQPEQEIDYRIRKAINVGFDRKSMMAYLRNNIGKPADGGIIPYGLPGNISGCGYKHNPDLAKNLIEEVKEEKGTLPEITLTTVGNYRDLCEYIQSELGKIGLSINVDVVPPANLREQKSQGVLPFYRASWIADYPDAENYLSLFYGPNRSPGGPNYSRFSSVDFNNWYEDVNTKTSEHERLDLYKRMDSLIVHHAPIVPLYYDEVVRIYPKNFTGLKGNSLNQLDLRYVAKIESK